MLAWLLLLGAIVLEVAGTTSMKLSEGFTKPLPSVLIFVCYGLSFVGLTFTLKYIDMSTAYAIWAGTGTALIATIGFIHFAEPVTLLKLACIGLIILGVIGLNLANAQH